MLKVNGFDRTSCSASGLPGIAVGHANQAPGILPSGFQLAVRTRGPVSLRSRTCTSFRNGSLSNNYRHRIAEVFSSDRWANPFWAREFQVRWLKIKAMVLILLAFSATGSPQCSARCQAWRDDGNWERPVSQQWWRYQLDVVEKRAGPVLSVDPTSGSRAVRMIRVAGIPRLEIGNIPLHPARVVSSGSLLRGGALLFRSSSQENVRQGIIPVVASVLIDRTVRLPCWNLAAPGPGESRRTGRRRTGLRSLELCNIVQLAGGPRLSLLGTAPNSSDMMPATCSTTV
jgi:hypothetical protein